LKQRVANVGVHSYYPAGGQRRPIAQIEAYRCIDRYILSTPFELVGEGITLLDKYTEEGLATDEFHKGWNKYEVTSEAFEKLADEYAILIESL